MIFFSLPRISFSINSLNGEKIGAYFGASLLASDVNTNGVDDLFVGAPTYSINQYDEGCVYFYKSKGDVSFTTKIYFYARQPFLGQLSQPCQNFWLSNSRFAIWNYYRRSR